MAYFLLDQAHLWPPLSCQHPLMTCTPVIMHVGAVRDLLGVNTAGRTTSPVTVKTTYG